MGKFVSPITGEPIPAELARRPFWERIGGAVPQTFQRVQEILAANMQQAIGIPPGMLGAGLGEQQAAAINARARQAALIQQLGGPQQLKSELVELQRRANEIRSQRLAEIEQYRRQYTVRWSEQQNPQAWPADDRYRDLEAERRAQQAAELQLFAEFIQRTAGYNGDAAIDPGVMLEDPKPAATPRVELGPVLRPAGNRKLSR